MIRHALRGAILGSAAILALNACAGATAPSPSTASTPAVAPAAPADPSPAATGPASPSSAGSTVTLGPADLDRRLDAGTYRIGDTFGAPFEITLPPSWRLKGLTTGDVEFAYTVDGEHSPAWVVVDLVENVFEDPCHSAGGPADPAVPQTTDGIVAALTHMVGYEAGPVTDVTIDGRAGKAVDLVNTIDTETAACDGEAMLPMWTFAGGAASTNGLAREQIRVVEIDGAPVIIDGETFASTSDALQGETREVMDSLAFE